MVFNKSLISCSILGVLLLMLSSCTEVIDVDLNATEPQIVIEGSLSNAVPGAIIKITESVNFDESNDFPAVENAMVEISDENGNSEILTETRPGVYESENLTGEEGINYTLHVTTAEKTLASSCKIPKKVPFLSMKLRKLEGGGGGPGGFNTSTNFSLVVEYQDPEGEENYYRFVEYKNGEVLGHYSFDDRLTDGQKVDNMLISFDRNLESGDTLSVVMQCIDKTVFEYFNSFGNLLGGPQNSSTPANPYTNIEGSVLGYFSAHTSEVKEVVVP